MTTGRSTLCGIRARAARERLSACDLCPRLCGVDRLSAETGQCRAGAELRVSAVALHTGEEPALGGDRGVCNVFLTGCNLHCRFCQNHPISHLDVGRDETPSGLARRIDPVLREGVRVLDFVTGSHQLPGILETLAIVLEAHPDLVVAWNSGGYERPESLRLLEGIVDVYLPDLKFMDEALAREMASAPDYPQVARLALIEMARQVGPPVLDPDGIARRGLIVRHLVLPGRMDDTRRVLEFVARELPVDTAVSLMGQYVPMGEVLDHPTLGRRLDDAEYRAAVDALEGLGIENGWIQDLQNIEG